MISNFQQVARWNEDINNPKGDPATFDAKRIAKQLLNVPDELGETFVALGADPVRVKILVAAFKEGLADLHYPCELDINGVRDGLIDQHVFLYGAHHLIGCDADADMCSVMQGLYTRFIKNEEDEIATIKKHADKGVIDVYFEGEYPTRKMTSASDQPDAPTGKFLKSASFSEPKLYPVPPHVSLARFPDYGTADAPKAAPATVATLAEFNPLEIAKVYTFDEFVQYGRDHGANIVNGMPWSFSFYGTPVSHENDQRYLINTPNCTLNFTPADLLAVDIDGVIGLRVGSVINPNGYTTTPAFKALSDKIVGEMNDEARKLLDRHNASIGAVK